jgi:hypothetical protein
MTISLTKDEFKKRLSKRHEILGLAMTTDMHEIFPEPYCYPEGMPIILSDCLMKFTAKQISRLIDLIYDESMD